MVLHQFISKVGLLAGSVLFFTTTSAVGQLATIQDEDGFTNVRKYANVKSKIVHKLYEDEAFWYDDSDEAADWIAVYIPKNNYSIGCSPLAYITGFIHKSRLLPLDQITPYQEEDFCFKYKLEKFDSTGRIVDWEGADMIAIDGRHAWGTDGNLPTVEVSDVNASIKGKRIKINQVFFSDIYECTNAFSIRRKGNTYFVYQENSDGAGYYQIVWVLTKEGLKQRLVGSIL